MFLLDTNVISELRKVRAGKADPQRGQLGPNRPGRKPFPVRDRHPGTGDRHTARRTRNPPKGAILRVWLDEHVLRVFSERILLVDMAVARRSAALHVPDPRPVRDGLIAATALVHGMTVVARNVTDFEHTGVPLLNPWAPLLGSKSQTP